MNYKELQKNFREASDVHQQLLNDIIFLKAQNENLVATNKKLSDQIVELKRTEYISMEQP